MEYLQWAIPTAIIIVGAIVHIEVNLAILKTDIKWIKRQVGIKASTP